MKAAVPIRPRTEIRLSEHDLEFAEHAVDYLYRQGLTRDEVARALIEQCGLDYATAYSMAV